MWSDKQKIESLMAALGLALDRLEGASHCRPPSEDRECLIQGDKIAIDIGRNLIRRLWRESPIKQH